MVVLSNGAIDEVHRLLTEQGIVIQPDRVRDLIAGIRLRLQDIAKGLSVEEEIAATIHVLKDAYVEIKLLSAGTGLDQEQLAELLWDVLEASAGTTKGYSKLTNVTTSEETWQDMCARLFVEIQVEAFVASTRRVKRACLERAGVSCTLRYHLGCIRSHSSATNGSKLADLPPPLS